MKARLTFQRDGLEQACELGASGVTIGRDQACELVVAKAGVSGRHCRLWMLEGAWQIEDLESQNGTFLNGELVLAPSRLADGDRIQLGGEPVLFEASFTTGDARKPGGTRVADGTELLAELRTQLVSARAALAERDAAARETALRITAAEIQVRDAQRRTEQDTAEIVRLTDALESTRGELAELKILHGDARDDLVAARQRLIELETQIDANRAKAKSDYDEVDQRRRKAEKELAKVDAELAETRSKLALATENLEHYQREHALLLADVEGLRS